MDAAALSTELCGLAREGLVEKLDQLLKCGADFDAKDYDERSCLHVGASAGNLSIVRLLLDAGAHVNAKDQWGGTPLRDAVRRTRREVAAETDLQQEAASSSSSTSTIPRGGLPILPSLMAVRTLAGAHMHASTRTQAPMHEYARACTHALDWQAPRGCD